MTKGCEGLHLASSARHLEVGTKSSDLPFPDQSVYPLYEIVLFDLNPYRRTARYKQSETKLIY